MFLFGEVIEICDEEVVVFDVLCGLFEVKERGQVSLVGVVVHVERDGVVLGFAFDVDVFHGVYLLRFDACANDVQLLLWAATFGHDLFLEL